MGNIYFENQRVHVKGESSDLWIEDYPNVYVDTMATVYLCPEKSSKKVLLVLDEIDGEHAVCCYVRKSKVQIKQIRHKDDLFEVVDSVPLGYSIWNIGTNMVDGYLPFCRLSKYQPFEGATNIETDTLKAIKVDGAKTILAAIGDGANTIEKMESYIEKHRNAKPNTVGHMYVKRCKKALPYMRKIQWN